MIAAPARTVQPDPTRPRRSAVARIPLIPALTIIAILTPEAFGLMVGDFRMTPARMFFLAIAPWMVVSFATLLGSARYRFSFSDLFIPLAAFWTIFALSRTEGFEAALKSGGVTALEVLSPYLVMRAMLHNVQQVHRIIRFFCIALAITGPLAIADTIAQHPFISDTLGQLTGYHYFVGVGRDNADYFRLGLFRAQGIYEHPIFLGVVMTFGLMLSRDLTGAARTWVRIGCGFALLLPLSSAPWQACLMGFGMMLFSRIFGFPHRWLLVVVGVSFGAIAVFMSFANPWGWIFNHLTLDASTGYYRLLIWQYAGASVMQSPIFGIGLIADWARDDWMTASIDTHWLVLALHFGIPCAVMTALGFIGACTVPVRQTIANSAQIGPREVKLAESLGIVIFLIIFQGFTTAYWGLTGMLIGLIAGWRACLGQLATNAYAPRPVIARANKVMRAQAATRTGRIVI